GLGARVEERGLRRARERRERGKPLGVLDVDLVRDDREVGVEEARGLLLHRRDDARVGVADCEAADAACEVDEAVAVDIGDERVDRLFRVFHNNRYPFIDVKVEQAELTELVEVEDRAFILHPGEFVLGSTLERIKLPDDVVARLDGKSSLGRLGLLIHSTAGFIDPGWDGHVTLELSNVANLPITIYPGIKIGQISFVQLTEPAQAPYGSSGLGSKYQGQ